MLKFLHSARGRDAWNRGRSVQIILGQEWESRSGGAEKNSTGVGFRLGIQWHVRFRDGKTRSEEIGGEPHPNLAESTPVGAPRSGDGRPTLCEILGFRTRPTTQESRVVSSNQIESRVGMTLGPCRAECEGSGNRPRWLSGPFGPGWEIGIDAEGLSGGDPATPG